MTRALCHFDNAYWLPDVAMHGYSAQDQHAEQHRVPRLRRAAGRDRDRGHPRRDRARARQGPARRAARQLLRHRRATTSRRTARRVDDNVIHELTDELERDAATTARAAPRSPRFNADSPVLKRGLALTPVKFGISFNVDALQPGRRAGARLHRRLDPGEPRRHRDGPGPEHQGRAGGGARARRAASSACASPPPTRRRSPTPRPPRHRPAAT